MKIKTIKSDEILDSRGIPTVSVEVELEDGTKSFASVPSGTSTGAYEAHELRDGDERRYNGKGVLKACENIEKFISPRINGISVFDQTRVDELMIDIDGTPNKEKLGANAMLAVSLAVIRAHSIVKKEELYETIGRIYGFKEAKIPSPLAVIIEGGSHSDSNADIQEYMVELGNDDFDETVRKITLIYDSLEEVLKNNGKNTNVGFEGAFGPSLSSNREALDLIMQAIQRTGLKEGKDVRISLDIAASEIYDAESKKYLLRSEDIALTAHQMTAYLEEISRSYPILSIEDGMAEDDWEGWQHLNERLGTKIILVGDDLFVTNTERIRSGIDRNAANAVLIKPNQIGTVTETVAAIKMAKFAGWEPIVSHRSGETNDTFIADLAVASGCSYIKIGAPTRGERVAKYNRLSEIAKKFSSIRSQ